MYVWKNLPVHHNVIQRIKEKLRLGINWHQMASKITNSNDIIIKLRLLYLLTNNNDNLTTYKKTIMYKKDNVSSTVCQTRQVPNQLES